jgi:DNA-directed RNA polymerase specialized sigma24 family protein
MEASECGSVTNALADLKNGDPSQESHKVLWERYFNQLAAAVNGHLRNGLPAFADGEDAALSAIFAVTQGISRGSFPKLDDREDLWCILLTVTRRKVSKIKAREHAQRRGDGRTRSETDLAAADPDDFRGIDFFVSDEPTPEFAAMFKEEHRRLIAKLPSEVHSLIVTFKMEGYTNSQIAERIHESPRSVERKLSEIRKLWSQDETAQ